MGTIESCMKKCIYCKKNLKIGNNPHCINCSCEKPECGKIKYHSNKYLYCDKHTSKSKCCMMGCKKRMMGDENNVIGDEDNVRYIRYVRYMQYQCCPKHTCDKEDCFRMVEWHYTADYTKNMYKYCSEHKCKYTKCSNIVINDLQICTKHKCDKKDCCKNISGEGYRWCLQHKCSYNNCRNIIIDNSQTCVKHKCQNKEKKCINVIVGVNMKHCSECLEQQILDAKKNKEKNM